MVFVKRQLDRDPQTLGEKLRALRRGQAVSLERMERETHIQHRYLLALERGIYEELPEPMYTRNFIRAYARTLHADENYFLELYMEECGECDLVEPMRAPRQRLRRMKLFVWNRLAKVFALLFVGGCIIAYLGWQVHSITAPPNVLLFYPNDYLLTNEPSIEISGLVAHEASVYVNGKQIILNEDRTFSSRVDLEKGLNVVSIEAERRYSKRAREERHIVFEPEDGFTVNN